MNLGDVMDQLAARLDTIAGLRCFAWPTANLTPPGAIVLYPDDYTYDLTYGRGSDTLTIPVLIVDGKPSDRSTRDRIAAYANGSGARSVKQVLESGTYAAFDDVFVRGVEFNPVTIAGVDHMTALFTLDITGPGSG